MSEGLDGFTDEGMLRSQLRDMHELVGHCLDVLEGRAAADAPEGGSAGDPAARALTVLGNLRVLVASQARVAGSMAIDVALDAGATPEQLEAASQLPVVE